ncbi:MAG: malto-oligosyltrehalose trehalohydrolase [Pirellulales bacterium]|nr:malto-oligosyltrehalose trehalohydrolase [Pirellulales bacterium]
MPPATTAQKLTTPPNRGLANLTMSELPLGATYLGDGQTGFNVWAPKATSLEVVIASQQNRAVPLDRIDGYHCTIAADVPPGTRYLFRFPDGRQWPDPASRFQPEGVHKPSAVVASEFAWTDSTWRGLPLAEYVLYELHVGVFTPEGTFDGVISQLDALVELGITAIELMPLAQFPGRRNWGYDGVHPFAVQNSYGGPLGLKRLVDAAHVRGLAVVLDVVYNHLGPEGNYFNEYAPYFTERYHTPWGAALNFDGPNSDEVRRFFLSNALEWITAYYIDALRLDAIHAIVDESAFPFLKELAAAVRARGEELGRHVFTIAESNRNDPRHILSAQQNGFGLDAQWNDDFEHALRVALTGNADGYYCDYRGLEKLAKAFRDGFVLDGGYSSFYRRRHGAPASAVRAGQLVVFSQNHDQVGNRPCGERLCHDVDFESAKLAAAAVIFSASIPLLFMGEEYAEQAPFLYFVSHSDPALLEAVRKGRREEFVDFEWPDTWPDPCSEQTFDRSHLNHALRFDGRHATMWNYYQELIRLRKEQSALWNLDKNSMNVELVSDGEAIFVLRMAGADGAAMVMNFADHDVDATLELPCGIWRRVLDSSDVQWGGPGSQLARETTSSGNIRVQIARRSALVWVR